MAKSVNTANNRETKLRWSTRQLKKLHLMPDLSVNREPVQTGMFKHWWHSFRKNMTTMFTHNIMFLLFCLPLFVLVFFIMPTLIQKDIQDNAFNFIGDFGFGFTGTTNDATIALRRVYIFRILFYLLMIPCFTLVGLGASGIFYSMRNRAWGADVKVRIHFFRGIKKFWWKFMLAFTLIGVLVYGVVASIQGCLLFALEGTLGAHWWIVLITVLLCIITLLVAMFMMIYLPTVTMYREKHKFIIKNAIILGAVTAPPMLILMILMAAPPLLALTSVGMIIMAVFFALYGLSMYVLAIQCFGQYCADNYVKVLYEQSLIDDQRNRRRNNRGGSGKKKKSGKKK